MCASYWRRAAALVIRFSSALSCSWRGFSVNWKATKKKVADCELNRKCNGNKSVPEGEDVTGHQELRCRRQENNQVQGQLGRDLLDGRSRRQSQSQAYTNSTTGVMTMTIWKCDPNRTRAQGTVGSVQRWAPCDANDSDAIRNPTTTKFRACLVQFSKNFRNEILAFRSTK